MRKEKLIEQAVAQMNAAQVALALGKFADAGIYIQMARVRVGALAESGEKVAEVVGLGQKHGQAVEAEAAAGTGGNGAPGDSN